MEEEIKIFPVQTKVNKDASVKGDEKNDNENK